LNPLVYVIYVALNVYAFLIVAAALLSWFQARAGTALFRVSKVLHDVTEPYVGLFRRVLPVVRLGSTGLDLSPVVALIVLFVAIQVVRFL
jgi:YggT family protein